VINRAKAIPGQFIIALNVARFLPLDAFKAEVDRHVQDLATSQRLPGVDEIVSRGTVVPARMRNRIRNGVPLRIAC